MNNPLDELFDFSREWVLLPRTSHVALAAISFLQRTFQIDAGFVNYGRNPRTNGADYLLETKRWFTSWGFDTPEMELKRAIGATLAFTEEVRQRQWFSPSELPPVWQEIAKQNGIEQVGIWVVNFQREPVGLFVLARKSKQHVDDSQLISWCMAHIAVVLDVVITRRLAEELSIRDPLTASLNRRGLLSEFDRLANGERLLTLAVIDLDGFKQYNDRHGHVAGDALFTTVADVLSRHAEAYQGVCARMGGDEFVIVAHYVVHDPQRAAAAIAGWLLEAGVLASVGCAVLGVDGDNFDTCYRVADLRLYEMKSQTREVSANRSANREE